VIGTAWQSLEAGARVVFVYNNPTRVLRATVIRSREVIDEPRIEKVNLTTGPDGAHGSTRMQATSIQLLAVLTVLRWRCRDLLAPPGAPEPGIGEATRGRGHAGRVATCTRSWPVSPARGTRPRRAGRGGPLPAGMRTSYFADALAVECSPTRPAQPDLCTPSFRKWDDETASESWAFLFTASPTTEEA